MTAKNKIAKEIMPVENSLELKMIIGAPTPSKIRSKLFSIL